MTEDKTKCLTNKKVKSIFPKKVKLYAMKKRRQEFYKIKKSNTKRYKNSAIPYMAKLLNDDNEKRRKILDGPY